MNAFWNSLTNKERTHLRVTFAIFMVMFIFLLAACSAQAREVYNTPSGRLTKGANCILIADSSTVRSPCSVGRAADSGNTLVVMNQLKMVIKRSGEPGAGSAYIVEEDGELSPIATVVAVGNCWVGHKFKFCAD
jgi:hypothetical protein